MPQKRRGTAATLTIAALALVFLASTFNPAVRRNLVPKNFGVVEDGRVYRAGQLTPAAMRTVHERYAFKTIIDLGSHERDSRGDRLNQRMADSLGIVRYRFDGLDGYARGNPNAYVEALRLMTDPANQPVLVHCGAGSERTSCVVLLYNNITHGTSLEDGLQGARDFKHRPHRNPHLREVVEKWGLAIIEAYRSGGPVSGAPPMPEPASVAGNPNTPISAAPAK